MWPNLNSVLLLTQWYAICLSDVGDYEGVKVKIGNAYIIRDHLEVREHWVSVILSWYTINPYSKMKPLFFQRAIMLNPKDATSLYIMGCW